jgi:8-oxo-dGTP diphosphatase
MKQVSKLIFIDPDNKYLLMKRSNHPRFGNDPDLPGGTLEIGEEPLEAMLREVIEEAGITVSSNDVEHRYTGADYSKHGTMYHLYVTRVKKRPQVTISWEHDSYNWIDEEDFLKQAGKAADTYMRMVYDVMSPSA